MTFPSCTISSPTTVSALLGGLTTAALSGTVLTFTCNIPNNTPIVLSGGIYIVQPVNASINSSGLLVSGGASGVVLLADDPSLGLTHPLQWTVSFTHTVVQGKPLQLSPWTFNSPTNGQTVPLNLLTPVPGVAAVGVVQISSVVAAGISDALPYSRGFLTGADNAADARTYLGINAGVITANNDGTATIT